MWWLEGDKKKNTKEQPKLIIKIKSNSTMVKNEKRRKDKHKKQDTTEKTKNRGTRNHFKPGWKVSRSCCTSGIYRFSLSNNIRSKVIIVNVKIAENRKGLYWWHALSNEMLSISEFASKLWFAYYGCNTLDILWKSLFYQLQIYSSILYNRN